MASEQGFTKIDNKFIEYICKSNLNGTEIKILLAISRATQGFGKDTHKISLRYLAEYLGVGSKNKTLIKNEFDALRDADIITATHPGTRRVREVGINKNIYQSMSDAETVHQVVSSSENENCTSGSVQGVHQVVSSSVHHMVSKKRNNKEKGKNKNNSVFFDLLWDMYPNQKGRSQITASAIKEIEAIGFDKMKECIERYKSFKPEWQTWQNGNTFFNGGYKDYLEQMDNDGKAEMLDKFEAKCQEVAKEKGITVEEVKKIVEEQKR